MKRPLGRQARRGKVVGDRVDFRLILLRGGPVHVGVIVRRVMAALARRRERGLRHE